MRVLITALVLFSGLTVYAASADADCTSIGSAGRDIITGGSGRQVICLKGSGDYGHGQSGNDQLRGGGQDDTLIGGPGSDVLRGKKGNDRLFSVDGVQGNDTLKGGEGNDDCYADFHDAVHKCETVHRGGSIAAVTALSSQFGGVMALAEEQISEPPTVTVTETVTITVPANCDSNPAPPPIC